MRFQPDTWYEALLRPVAMASPQANVYVEIMAPDFRLAFVLALLALLALWAALSVLRGRPAGAGGAGHGARPVFTLAGVLAVAFTVWLATTANGRYFLAALLITGPVCVGLARLLPVTRSLRLSLAVGMVALQAFAVQQSSPWQAWGLATWKDAPYFQAEVPARWREQPATYVTMSAISYSLVAPLFHPQSRWLSLHNAPAGIHSPDGRRADAFLSGAQAGRLMLLVPALPGMLTPERLPNERAAEAMGDQLAPYRLAFAQPQSCVFLPSRSLAGMGLGEKTPEQRAQAGFWLCHLVRLDASASPETRPGRRYDAVFEVLESQCPRFFPAGGDRNSVVLAEGEVRSYLQAEMKAYVYDSGEVFYKYYRALTPVRVGTAADLLAGRARVDCGKIRGRSGLPWEREI